MIPIIIIPKYLKNFRASREPCAQNDTVLYIPYLKSTHVKHSNGVFRKVLSKDYTSNQPQGRWVDFKSGIAVWESQNL